MMSKPKVAIGIPVRMGSTRFPGKPICNILGVPMIEHVYRRCLLAGNVDRVFVAACDDEIERFMKDIGGEVVMTPKEIDRPGLRVAEAAKILGLDDNDIVAVVQGDEPLVHPESIEQGIKPLIEDPGLFCTNLCADASEKEWKEINDVKVVVDKDMNLLFLSRSPIPSNTRNRIGPRLKQLGIFFFRMKFMIEFQNLTPMPLEVSESIELLRALEHGKRIRMVKYPYIVKSVDTDADRMEAEDRMREDPIWPLYKEQCNVAS